MSQQNLTCKYCEGEMELQRHRTLSTGTYHDGDRKDRDFTIRLADYKCKTCGAAYREGVSREHDIWISPLFLGAAS